MSYIEKECEQHHEYCMSQQCNTVEVRLAPNWTVFLPAQYWLTTMNPYTILLSMSINDHELFINPVQRLHTGWYEEQRNKDGNGCAQRGRKMDVENIDFETVWVILLACFFYGQISS